MTRDEILAMEPGRELDVLVAEEVMGFDVVEDPESAICGGSRVSGGLWVIIERDYHEWGHKVDQSEPYSTDIAAAWEVVEKMDERKRWVHIRSSMDQNLKERGWAVDMGRWWNRTRLGVWARTVPEAICKAALLAVMEAG